MEDLGNICVSWVHGYAGQQIHHINAKTISYICGSNVKFVNTTNKEERVFKGPGNGIAALATSSDQSLFAIAESCLNPKIFICKFPEMEVLTVLEGGAMLEYKLMAFSWTGPYLATYSGIPDFTLAVWNTSMGTLLCKYSLKSDSPISSISFNPLNWHYMSICGEEQISILTVEECNKFHTIKSRKVMIPEEDGGMRSDEEEGTSRSATRAGLHIHIAQSTKAGLVGEHAKQFKSRDQQRPRMKPSSHCWSNKGEFYVGCHGGQLFTVDSDTGRITVLMASHLGEMVTGMFNTLNLNTQGLFCGGTDGILRNIHIGKNGIKITKEYEGTSEICAASFSPSLFMDLTIGTSSGLIQMFNTKLQSCSVLSNTHFGKFIGASYNDDGNVCVSCREDGEVQLWEAEYGSLVSSISLETKTTAMSASPSCSVVAVGTWTGHIFYIDISDPMKPRVIARHRLHHGPVTFLHYNKYGQYLLSASREESQIFVINAKPSSDFSCIGYIDCKGIIKNITLSQFTEKEGYVAAVVIPSAEKQDKEEEEEVEDEKDGEENEIEESACSDRLVIFSLSDYLVKNAEENYASLRKNFKDDVINRLTFDLTVALDSAVITQVNSSIEIFALGQVNRKLLHFKFPTTQDVKDSTTIHNPSYEQKSHELSDGSILLSPHGQWLMSCSPDGDFIIRDVQGNESHLRTKAHSYLLGGVLTAFFSPDGQRIITVGRDDMSLVSYSWNLTGKGRIAMNSTLEYARSLDMQLRSIAEQENTVSAAMSDWVEPVKPHIRALSNASTESHDNIMDVARETRGSSGGECERRSSSAAYSEIAMTPTPVPLADSTWLDAQLIIAHKQENAKYDKVKSELRKNIKELRKTILGMMEDNRNRPEIEQLDPEEYNLDAEEQKRLQEEEESRVQKVREDIEFENLAQKYLKYLLQKECWDDMTVKGRAVKSFNTNVSVTNYPMKAQTPTEIEIFNRVQRIRDIEIQDLNARKEIVEISTTKPAMGEEEEDEEENNIHPDRQLSLHGSLGPKYGGENELFYSQFDLHTREQKINQIVLVKDAIRRIKNSFNEAFENTYRSKEQEINRAKEKNIRIREIMQELDMDASDVKDTEMDVDEKPEKVLTVSDSEVEVERVLSLEQEKEKLEEEKQEQARLDAAKSDNKRERGLVDMMGGVLEVKKEDILKQDIPTPEFLAEKLEKDWTDEERKMMKEYEKKQKDLQEEREKYRKNLENELKKLQQAMIDVTASFDEQLLQLYNRKVKTEMVINQEELKILRLSCSILMDDEINTQEEQLNFLMKFGEQEKLRVGQIEMEIRKLVDEYREVYDSVVAEDKMLDRSFKRDFSDVPLSVSDQLYKLFKRRPRIQRQQTVEDQTLSVNPYATVMGSTKVSNVRQPLLGADLSSTTLTALPELDDISNAPEGVEEVVWDRLCVARKSKVESELRVKQCAMTLAEMTQFLQHRQEESEMMQREIEDIIKQLNGLCEDRMKNNLNLEIQFLLKQGQVEVETGNFIADYSDSILIHRGVVEDLNGSIRGLGESKVAAMTECKDFKKGIHLLEWERKRMMMQMEDLHNKARHIQMLKLTKDLQLYLNEENHQARQAKQMAVLEQTLALQDKQLDKNLNQRQSTIQELEKTILHKQLENEMLESQAQELHVSVSERKNISDVNASERAKNTADKRLRGIVQRRKLVDLAKAQAQEVAVLRAEVERLRMKTFPALVQVDR